MNLIEQRQQNLRRFGLMAGGFIIVVFGFLFPFWRQTDHPLWVWGVGGFFCGLALLRPSWLRPVFTLWMRVAEVIGWINTRIIFGVVFFVMVTPLAYLLRVMRKDSLCRKFESGSVSYRIPSTPTDAKNMENPY